MVADVKKKRDEAELLSADAKDKKQAEIDEKIKALQEFDRTTRDALRKERAGRGLGVGVHIPSDPALQTAGNSYFVCGKREPVH